MSNTNLHDNQRNLLHLLDMAIQRSGQVTGRQSGEVSGYQGGSNEALEGQEVSNYSYDSAVNIQEGTAGLIELSTIVEEDDSYLSSDRKRESTADASKDSSPISIDKNTYNGMKQQTLSEKQHSAAIMHMQEEGNNQVKMGRQPLTAKDINNEVNSSKNYGDQQRINVTVDDTKHDRSTNSIDSKKAITAPNCSSQGKEIIQRKKPVQKEVKNRCGVLTTKPQNRSNSCKDDVLTSSSSKNNNYNSRVTYVPFKNLLEQQRDSIPKKTILIRRGPHQPQTTPQINQKLNECAATSTRLLLSSSTCSKPNIMMVRRDSQLKVPSQQQQQQQLAFVIDEEQSYLSTFKSKQKQLSLQQNLLQTLNVANQKSINKQLQCSQRLFHQAISQQQQQLVNKRTANPPHKRTQSEVTQIKVLRISLEDQLEL